MRRGGAAVFERSPVFAIHTPQFAVSSLFAIHSKIGRGGGCDNFRHVPISLLYRGAYKILAIKSSMLTRASNVLSCHFKKKSVPRSYDGILVSDH
jgi:hypothetical protein